MLSTSLTLFTTVPSVFSQTDTKTYIIDQSFDGYSEAPTGWSGINTPSKALFGRSGNIEFDGNAVKYSATNQSGSRGAELQFPAIKEVNKAHLEFDWKISSANIGQKNIFALYLAGSQSSGFYADNWSDARIDALACLYLVGNDAKLHCWNKDLRGSIPDSLPVLTNGKYPSFGRDAGSLELVNTWNSSTQTDVSYIAGIEYHVYALLNFQTKRIEKMIVAEKGNEATNTTTLLNLPFIRNSTEDLFAIGLINTRGTVSNGNGILSNFESYIDNIQIYTLTSDGISGVNSPKINKVVTSEYFYNLAGVKVDAKRKGILMRVQIYEDGTTSRTKILNN